MSVEDHVRRVLADERLALPAWSDPVQRVGDGIRRRRRRRLAAATVAAAAVVTAAVAAPAAVHWTGSGAVTPADPGEIVPWLDAPAPTPTGLARREQRPDARSCTAADLNRMAWTEPGPDSMGFTVLLSNTSDSVCTLRAEPILTATDPASRRRIALPTTYITSTDGASQHPATIGSGEPARLDVITTKACQAGSADPVTYREPALELLGRRFPIAGLPLTTACPVGLGTWRVLPPLLNVPFQIASIQAPPFVHRGQILEYTVTILNSGDAVFRLDPCPVYTQSLGSTARSYLLNCGPEEIAAHESVRFQMRLQVPTSAPLGTADLTWLAANADGMVIIADLATAGVKVRVLD